MLPRVEMRLSGSGIRVVVIEPDGAETLVYSGFSVTEAYDAYNRCLYGAPC